MITIDAAGAHITPALIAQALSGVTPKWAKAHSLQYDAWKKDNPESIGISGVSVIVDDELPQNAIQFFDSVSVLITKAADGTALPKEQITSQTTWTTLSQIINLGIPA